MTATLNRPADQKARDTQRADVGRAPNFPESHTGPDTQNSRALGDPISSDDQNSDETQHAIAVAGTTLPAPTPASIPKDDPVQGQTCDEGHGAIDAHTAHALVGTNLPAAKHDSETNVPTLQGSTSTAGHCPPDAQLRYVGRGAILRDPFLALLADAVDDLERVRIASENRYRQLTRSTEDADGEERGFGLTDAVPEVLRVRQVVEGLVDLEHKAVLNLQRQIRKHPLWIAWGKDAKGVGEKQLARLLATIGDPYWNDLHQRPRTVSELWAYSGFSVIDGASQRRTKGAKVNWSPDARMRTWLITGACLKAQGHHAEIYYAAREKYAEATHHVECVRCGPKGRPALAGSPLSLAHQHARALRAIAKEVLKDLWLTAMEIHHQDASPSTSRENEA